MIRSCDTLMLLYLFRSDIIQEQIDHPFGCHERADLVVQDLLLRLFQHAFYRRVMIELIPQRVVDAFVHPIFALLITAVLKVTIIFHKSDVLVNHIPDFLHTQVIETGIGHHLRCPS